MTIYLAGKVTARDRLRPIRARIVACGHRCESSWIDRACDYPVPRDRAIAEGQRDLHEINRAHTLIVDTLDESATGGREVEVGYALARDVPVWRVGPVRNIFHEFVERAFAAWGDVWISL